MFLPSERKENQWDGVGEGRPLEQGEGSCDIGAASIPSSYSSSKCWHRGDTQQISLKGMIQAVVKTAGTK